MEDFVVYKPIVMSLLITLTGFSGVAAGAGVQSHFGGYPVEVKSSSDHSAVRKSGYELGEGYQLLKVDPRQHKAPKQNAGNPGIKKNAWRHVVYF